MTFRAFGEALEKQVGHHLRVPFEVRIGNPTLPITQDRIRVPASDSDQPGMVYFHDTANGESVGKALNTVLDLNRVVFGDYIQIQELSGGRYEVVRFGRFSQAAYRADVPVYSSEPVNIERMNWGLLQPTNPPSMRALISPAFYGDGKTLLPATEAFIELQDFTAFIPSTPNTAVAINIALNTATGAVDYTVGSEFSHIDYASHQAALATQYPDKEDATYYRVGWIRLVYGMTAILKSNIFPAPEILSRPQLPVVTNSITGVTYNASSGDVSVFWGTPDYDPFTIWAGSPDEDKYYVPRDGVYDVSLFFRATFDNPASGVLTVGVFQSHTTENMTEWVGGVLNNTVVSRSVTGRMWLSADTYIQVYANNAADENASIDFRLGIMGVV